jgi:hypothetical protein
VHIYGSATDIELVAPYPVEHLLPGEYLARVLARNLGGSNSFGLR